MTAEHEVFAAAERLAHYARGTFGDSPMRVLDVLAGWRDRNDMPLSDGALALVVAHVCQYRGSLRSEVAA